MKRKISLLSVFLLVNILLPAQANPKQVQRNIVRGNCGKGGCSNVLKDLSSRYPDYVQKFNKECPRPKILALQVGNGNRNARQAWFSCWDAKTENKTRYGSFLGTLPLAGNEATFLTPLPSSAYTQELLKRYRAAIKKAQFQCATIGGNFNILEDEEKKTVQLQCYFQAGAQLLDENGDFVSDGEASRGAGVDEILGTFLVNR